MEYPNELWFLCAYLIGTIMGVVLSRRYIIEDTITKTLRVLDAEGVIHLNEETGEVHPIGFRDEQIDDLLEKVFQRIDAEEKERSEGEDKL